MKAVALLSGGLDSQLAVRLMLKQGIDVTAMHFRTIFCTCTPKGCGKSTASTVSAELGIPFVEFNNTKDILEVVKNPPHGYGSGMNPCIDCRIIMFKKAKQYMEKIGASFIITGEVLGQRPMSQRKGIIPLIEKESGLDGFIVRPLSAKFFPPTIPEQKGWIDRNKLLNHSGRSRKLQISMAEEFNMKDYPCASGGCLLTDPGFSRRIKECFKHGEDSLNDIQLLRIGRHFRLLKKAKLVIGRSEIENKRIVNLAQEGDIIIEPVNLGGPTSLLKKGRRDNIQDYLESALAVCAKYCKDDVVLRCGIRQKDEISWKNEINAGDIKDNSEENVFAHIV